MAVLDPAQKNGGEQALDELAGLVKTAGVKVVGRMVQVRGKNDPGNLPRSGKARRAEAAASTPAEPT